MLKWQTAEVWKFLRNGWEEVNREWDLLRKTAARVHQLDPVKSNLNWVWGLWCFICLQTAGLEHIWIHRCHRHDRNQPEEQQLVQYEKENWISLKNNSFFSTCCQSTMTQGKCKKASAIFCIWRSDCEVNTTSESSGVKLHRLCGRFSATTHNTSQNLYCRIKILMEGKECLRMSLPHWLSLSWYLAYSPESAYVSVVELPAAVQGAVPGPSPSADTS